MNKLSFDQVFKIWLDAELELTGGQDVLPFAKTKGFNSISEWRLASALRLGMDTKDWTLESIVDPAAFLPKIKIGPFQGWSKFFDNKLNTSFEEALEIPEFFEWCKTHDRIIPLSENFPSETTIILFRKPNGDLIHIEGGHRICAVAYKNKIGAPINFESKKVAAAIAQISDAETEKLLTFLKQGTNRQQ